MMNNNLLPLAKEGWKYTGYSLLAFIIFAILDLEPLEYLSFVVVIFFIYLFRNPERVVQHLDSGSLLSPVDGFVLSIENVKDSQYAYKVEIQSSYSDVSILRTPFDSTLVSSKIYTGSKLSNYSPLSKKINSKAELLFEDENSNKIRVVHTLKQSFNELKVDAVVSQKLTKGLRYGSMINGTTTLYIPSNFRLSVNVGNRVEGSQTLVGYFS